MLKIAENNREEHCQEILNAGAVGIQLDESTDFTGDKLLTINIKYLNDGEERNKFYV